MCFSEEILKEVAYWLVIVSPCRILLLFKPLDKRVELMVKLNSIYWIVVHSVVWTSGLFIPVCSLSSHHWYMTTRMFSCNDLCYFVQHGTSIKTLSLTLSHQPGLWSENASSAKHIFGETSTVYGVRKGPKHMSYMVHGLLLYLRLHPHRRPQLCDHLILLPRSTNKCEHHLPPTPL